MRLIILDFLGNILVRGRPDLVPRFVEMSNELLAGPLTADGISPFTLAEVEAYYRRDVFIWRIWRSLKVVGAVSDHVSSGHWGGLRQLGEIYRIWTRPIY